MFFSPIVIVDIVSLFVIIVLFPIIANVVVVVVVVVVVGGGGGGGISSLAFQQFTADSFKYYFK